jgi:hypothetical protein
VVKFNQLGSGQPGRIPFIGQFCSSPYITRFTREEVMKEYIFLHNFVNEGIKSGEVRDFSPELTITMFYQVSRVVVGLILDSNVPSDRDELLEKDSK